MKKALQYTRPLEGIEFNEDRTGMRKLFEEVGVCVWDTKEGIEPTLIEDGIKRLFMIFSPSMPISKIAEIDSRIENLEPIDDLLSDDTLNDEMSNLIDCFKNLLSYFMQTEDFKNLNEKSQKYISFIRSESQMLGMLHHYRSFYPKRNTDWISKK
tara:strand:- start:184 stop:648 length:465 start_codon:yes stop_codon:yes gene_type:complete